MLEVRRQRQALAEVLERLVRREPGADGGDLEQDAARLAEGDRAGGKAGDHGRRHRAGPADALAASPGGRPQRRPGDAGGGARARAPGLVGAVVVVRRAAPVAARLVPVVAQGPEAGALLEEPPARLRVGAVGADAVEPLQGERLRDVRVLRDQRLVLVL